MVRGITWMNKVIGPLSGALKSPDTDTLYNSPVRCYRSLNALPIMKKFLKFQRDINFGLLESTCIQSLYKFLLNYMHSSLKILYVFITTSFKKECICQVIKVHVPVYISV